MNIERAIAELFELNSEKQITGSTFAACVDALREKAGRENPKPLTLEQLKERVGKPVYRRWRNGNGTWEVLERIEEKTETGNPVILVFFQHDDWFPERFDLVEFFDHEPECIQQGAII